MFTFTKALKLYYFRDRGLISLSILCSEMQVLTFYIDKENFDRILAGHGQPSGVDTGQFLIQRKRDVLRFTHRTSSHMETNLRVPLAKWDELVHQFKSACSADKANLITCIVD